MRPGSKVGKVELRFLHPARGHRLEAPQCWVGVGLGPPSLVSERKPRSGGEGQLAQGYRGGWCRPGSGGLSLCLLCDLPCWPVGCCPSFSHWRIPAQAPSTSFLCLIPPATWSCNSDHHQHACGSPLEASSLDSELQPVCPAACLALPRDLRA